MPRRLLLTAFVIMLGAIVAACGANAPTATTVPASTSTPTPTVETSQPTATPTAIPTPTPDPTSTPTRVLAATAAPTPTPMAALASPTATQAPVTATPAPRPTATPTPAPTATPAPGAAVMLVLTPSQGGTLWKGESNTDSGSGTGLFVGRNSPGQPRRVLFRFDLTAIPADATVDSVAVTISANRSPRFGAQPAPFSLHCVNASWGEGASVAPGQGGRGTTALAGDATWTRRELGGENWSSPGGDFVAASSGTNTSGQWASSAELIADVQSWVSDPAANFGWIIIGDEATDKTAQRLYSHEDSVPPTLTITYTPAS